MKIGQVSDLTFKGTVKVKNNISNARAFAEESGLFRLSKENITQINKDIKLLIKEFKNFPDDDVLELTFARGEGEDKAKIIGNPHIKVIYKAGKEVTSYDIETKIKDTVNNNYELPRGIDDLIRKINYAFNFISDQRQLAEKLSGITKLVQTLNPNKAK